MASRAWQCGRFTLALDRPLVMGILNVTPDSFSDGGEYEEPLAALDWGLQMALDGAAIIDVGGESTRPGSAPITVAEELARVLPVVARLATETRVPVSVDTRHAAVAVACVEAGAAIVNDVAGFRDEAMLGAVAASEAGVVVMHMLGEPGTMQDDPRYDDVLDEVRGYLDYQTARLVAAGVGAERIAIDPGIGFGKTLEHNLRLLRSLPALAEMGFPVVVGASRKRFIGEITGEQVARERVGGSVAAALWAAAHGADVVRVHDVAVTAQALRVASALGAG